MPKHVVVTAGTVYGRLDRNKLVGNRIRGIWASRFADFLANRTGFKVTLVLADIQEKAIMQGLRYLPDFGTVVTHSGYEDYRDKVLDLARSSDALVAAAAVVNWIPSDPWHYKMPTKGFNEGDVINVPFMLAPKVINRVKPLNPRITLIGCKMTVGATHEEMVEAAYDVLLHSRANLVVANDMDLGLKRKFVVHQDRAVVPFNFEEGSSVPSQMQSFYTYLRAALEEQHFHTIRSGDHPIVAEDFPQASALFDRVVDRFRSGFVVRLKGEDKVFGAVAVAVPDPIQKHFALLVSPREKGQQFTAADAVAVAGVDPNLLTVRTGGGRKGTLNTPLLWRHLQYWRERGASALVHLHTPVEGIPTYPYAPPGTIRDAERSLDIPSFNIEGHGCVLALGPDLEILR